MFMWLGLMSCYGDGLRCLRWMLCPAFGHCAFGHPAFGHLAFGHLAFGQPSGIRPSGTGTSSLKPSLTQLNVEYNVLGDEGWDELSLVAQY